MQRLKLLNLEQSESEEEKLAQQPFELDKDLTLSNDASSVGDPRSLSMSKSLQVAKEATPILVKQRHSYDMQDLEGNVELVSSLDSSLLQGSPHGPDEPLDPLETSEDSTVPGVQVTVPEPESFEKTTSELVTVVSLKRPEGDHLVQPEPGLFIYEETDPWVGKGEKGVQAGTSGGIAAEVRPL